MDLIKFISDIGFPIAICLILIYRIETKIDTMTLDLKEIKDKLRMTREDKGRG
ncbi:YvrJ family protein [Anaerococcus sp. AGMB09787]|uniref:YvrJ family protein n=1 Tax=Anaerococcus sp. AGMB09787 TaxID=2922869 RepID=UPI001FAEEEC8|nr:YvrJ family protein [Anaerococcus sp. AGMB09787]